MLLRTCLAVLLAVSAGGQRPDPPLLVSAAISLSDALEAIAIAYETAGGGPVRFNFAASNVLARQIANGARADVFISADLVQMHHAERAGGIDVSSRRMILSNRLAVVRRAGLEVPLADARDLIHRAMKRIAIADPAAVPAGFYAKQYLERAGVWNQVQERLLPLANVRAALAAVESGGADAAIVYESDTTVARRAVLAFVVPAREAPSIVYPAAVVARSKHRRAAHRFLEFLRTPQAAEIFERYRFHPYVGVHQ